MAAIHATVNALDPSNSSKKMLKIENTEKRDALIDREKYYQEEWAKNRTFEATAPTTIDIPIDSISPADLRTKHPKWFGTMAFPYMNGTLHAGHSFTVSKVEFGAGVARMQRRRVLYPQGYHCTGMPIKACADKLVREIEQFGKNFERCPESAITNGDVQDEAPAPTQGQTKEDVTKFSAKKGKAIAKTVKLKYQFQIMLAVGTPLGEIHKFADPDHWLHHFPQLCKRDLTRFGCRIDWRRSFVTTDANPFYDSFVRWQMNRLRELNKIRFGKRYTVYSPKDGQACMDHDRSEGEGVGVQEYTALKVMVKEWPAAAAEKIAAALPANAKVYFVPATLRPETTYGQTCCFVGPKIKYAIFQANEEEYFFVSERAACNMSFQSMFSNWGKSSRMIELEGSEVIGTIVNAPLSMYRDIRVLPMESVKASKGTGVVTCAPSDSPDDYATIIDLVKKAEYYGIQKEWADVELVPLISTPTYGNFAAKHLVETMKINSPKDAKQLAEAKDLAYKEGYYRGTMAYGEFKGLSVIEAKPKVRQRLFDGGHAFDYAEPEGYVLSRSGDECVVAHLGQWYMAYGTTEKGGDGQWQKEVVDYLQDEHGLKTFSTDTKNAFEQTLAWLGPWACARSYGLGSKVPWDHSVMVESLSDSAIYMSYYTICHLLHKDIFGKDLGPLQIKPEQMTDEVWDYIFTHRRDVKTEIPEVSLNELQREFEYWYPLDLRTSGKDLIQNHLSFFLYVHLALFPKEYWPRSVRVNGHLLLNGEKMSKSTGNFLTLDDAVKKFGADATRVALADAGDGMDDANFDETVANSTILRLYELRKWCEEMIKEPRLVKSSEEYVRVRDNEGLKTTDVIQRFGEKLFWDNLFENELNGLAREAQAHYEGALYKAALKTSLYDLLSARDFYRETTRTSGHGMHSSCIHKYISLQSLLLTPITPHWSEHIHLSVLSNSTTVQNAAFPIIPDTDPALTAAREYVRSTTSNIFSAEGAQQKKLAKGKTVSYDPKKEKKLSVYVASKFPGWQDRCLELVRDNSAEMTVDVGKVSKVLPKEEAKKAMSFVTGLKKRLESGEEPGKVFERSLVFDEMKVLKEMMSGLRGTLQKCVVVELVAVEEGSKEGRVVGGNGAKEGDVRKELPSIADGAMPGAPTFHFENV